jgi:hypothetical protein
MRIWALKSTVDLTSSREDGLHGISNIALDLASTGVVVTGAHPETHEAESGIQAESESG